MKYLLPFFLMSLFLSCNSGENTLTIDYITPFEKSNGTKTAKYEEVISFYQKLAANYSTVGMYEMGPTDSGHPLHVVVFDPDGLTASQFTRPSGKNVLLINNGIHPGESDGIDASMLLFRDYAMGKLKVPKNTIITAIPIYNIGGSLNRNSGTRTNQNGPEEYGFRGNARNFDLNRDFIKADTKNARSFQHLFQKISPEAFIDNHVSNGADYQYVLTHLFTQHNKLGRSLGNYLHEKFQPTLEDSLTKKEWDITPYVNVYNRVPDLGFSQFMDSPRFSSGYTALFNCLGMMVETHMLKPYKKRVEGTYALMETFIAIMDAEAQAIKELRHTAMDEFRPGKAYNIQWKLDSSRYSTLQFKGYEGQMVTSDITGLNRLKYFQDKPFTKEVRYYDHFVAQKEVIIPHFYAIPQGQWPIVQALKNNGIEMKELKADTIIQAQVYRIDQYDTYSSPYEGHYPHHNTVVTAHEEQFTLREGDYLVSTLQPGVRYLLETLEPEAIDSFFNWNYFDAILQQKEGFSPYVWEDKALELLKNNPQLEEEFNAKKASDPAFANNWYNQLDWLHRQSNHYEKSHLRYPIVRVL